MSFTGAFGGDHATFQQPLPPNEIGQEKASGSPNARGAQRRPKSQKIGAQAQRLPEIMG